MKKTLIYAVVCSLATTALISPDYTNAKIDNNKVASIENNIQSTPAGWQFVKLAFQLHVPKKGKALSQLIIDVPSPVAVSNDIDVLDDKGQKIKINISLESKRIIIDFPEPVTSSTTKLQINLNKVLQPILGSTSSYHLSGKVVGSDVEIPISEAQFSPF
ncbi:DUF2808 domain-containing protein [Nostoc sp. 'Peltigera membranacea cyanobiont' N6]|uniref:DUF2808 domain-containing protein n=1 Tax=Nostoc sp. 'Peltigera membranacea cyanobiont' N6 TaxID=1261031 RepID=UPI000CF35F52|nr:DUF2808 domain-containing protein [Nostoc sp. 'Peltigera membranacea cyanobiont' N6]AVH68204.1 protein of unknown function DUF2808 [Nostoc sp. 'Peltigera membranacea cyanobiont' N6]